MSTEAVGLEKIQVLAACINMQAARVPAYAVGDPLNDRELLVSETAHSPVKGATAIRVHRLPYLYQRCHAVARELSVGGSLETALWNPQSYL